MLKPNGGVCETLITFFLEKTMELPRWLDILIYDGLNANYCPSYADMTNIDDDKEKALNYLGTYFPRSYAESYCIFNEYFNSHPNELSDKEDIAIFDFGSGTGGEIFGLLTVLDECFPNIKKVQIVALDGNSNALRLYERILSEFKTLCRFEIKSRPAQIVIDDFYDLSILDSVLEETFDIIISFKAICEFVPKKQFEEQNPYKHIANFLLPKLNSNGLLLLEDVTFFSDTSQEWLPTMMDNGLKAVDCTIVLKNNGFNQSYYITHSHKHNDKSKVAWRMIKQ